MSILGIDNGLDGALVWLAPLRRFVMPTVNVKDGKREYDVPAIIHLIESLPPEHVFFEKAQAMPGQGVTSMFSIGHGFGIMRGIVAAMKLPYTIVHPKTWQKEMLKDCPRQDTKAMAYLVCQRLWPDKDWRASERCKKPHDGLCDAVLIAEYGRRLLAHKDDF